MSGLRKYSFHPSSFLRNFMFMNDQQRYLFYFRKFTFCRHRHSCFEHVLRTVYRSVGLYLMIRVGAKLIMRDAVFEFFKAGFRKIFGEGQTDKVVTDTAFAVEINTIVAMNIYLLRRCFYSFFLEFLAD